LSDLPTGVIVMFAGPPDCIPPGWVLCDGRVVNTRSSPLRGRRTPDLRDRFPRGIADPGDERSIGAAGGRATVRHTHDVVHTHMGLTFEPEPPNGDGGAVGAEYAAVEVGTPCPDPGHRHSFTTSGPIPSAITAESEVPIDPPHVLVNFIMKVV